MSPEEITELVHKIIKEDISLNVVVNEYYGYFNEHGVDVTVEVLLSDEVIHTSSDRVPFPKQEGNW